MSERTKKILFAVFFILFSLGMGYGLYLLFFVKQTPTVPTTPTGTGLNGNLPSAGAGVPGSQVVSTTAPGGLPTGGAAAVPLAPTAVVKTHLLRDGVTQNISPSSDQNGARFYNPEDGRFYRVNADGSITALSDKQFFNVDKVAWANKTDKTILTFPDGSNIFYDFTQKHQVTLPSHWEDFNFQPNDSEVTAKSMGVDENNRFLITTNADGTEAKAIEPLGANGDKVHPAGTPDGQIIAFAETGNPQPGNNQEIFFVGQNHENFRSLIAPGQDFLPKWSPTGKQLLFSVWNQDSSGKPSLWLSGGQASTVGTNRRNLNIQTWADKCAWGGDSTIYCAVPQNLPINSGMDRSQFTTNPDDIFRIDLTNGTETKINTPDQNHPVNNPIITSDQSKMIFTDAASGKLYSYDLK